MLTKLGTPWNVLVPPWPVLGQSWGHPGTSWSDLGTSWRHLGRSWTVLEASWRGLGPPWRYLGAILHRFGAILVRKTPPRRFKTPPRHPQNTPRGNLDTPKNLIFLVFFNIFVFRGSRVNLNTYFASRGTIWRPLGVILGVLVPTCPILVPSWAAQKHSKRTPRGLQEASKRPLDESRHPKKPYFSCVFSTFLCFEALGSIFAPTSPVVEPSGALLASSWGVLVPTCPVLVPSWAVLASSWDVLGASWPPKALPKIAPRDFQDASQDEVQLRFNLRPFRDHF